MRRTDCDSTSNLYKSAIDNLCVKDIPLAIKEKEFTTALKSWRVTAKLLREVNIECAKKDLTHYELAEMAWRAYLQSRAATVFPAAPPPDDDRDHREFLHWLLDRILNRPENPHLPAIEMNLMLLAFGLYSIEGHPVEDLRGMLRMLYEQEKQPPPSPSTSATKAKKKRS